jgi:hypothetical protein
MLEIREALALASSRLRTLTTLIAVAFCLEALWTRVA